MKSHVEHHFMKRIFVAILSLLMVVSGTNVTALAEEKERNADVVSVSKTTQWETITGDELTGIPEMDTDELVKDFIQQAFDAQLNDGNTQSGAELKYLSGINEEIYNLIIPSFVDIANGLRSSTEIEINPVENGITISGQGSTFDEAADNARASLQNLGYRPRDIDKALCRTRKWIQRYILDLCKMTG